jgi:hypothetical protein
MAAPASQCQSALHASSASQQCRSETSVSSASQQCRLQLALPASAAAGSDSHHTMLPGLALQAAGDADCAAPECPLLATLLAPACR